MCTTMTHEMTQETVARRAVAHYSGDNMDFGACELVTTGEESIVVLCPEPSYEVISIPLQRTAIYARSVVTFHAEVLLVLQDRADDEAPPMDIPAPIEVNNYEQPYWLAMRRMFGRTLMFHEADQLGNDQKANVGAAVGAQAAWLARHISFDDYDTITQVSRRPADRARERIAWVKHYNGDKLGLLNDAYPSLHEILSSTYEQFRDLYPRGLIEPTIVGHDALEINNIVGAPESLNAWQPHATVDYGQLTKSIPERELRFMWGFDELAGRAAKQAYETAMGVQLSEELLCLWALLQCATNITFSINQSSPFGGSEHLASLRKRIERLAPYKDWSELDDDVRVERPGLGAMFKPGSVYIPSN